MTWGHGFLKQIKATSTCPTYICKLPSNEKQRPQPGRIDYIAHMELRYIARGFYIFQERIFQDIPCTYHHLDLVFQPKGIPHILEQALCTLIHHMQAEGEMKKFSQVRLYKQCHNKQGPVFLTYYWNAALSGLLNLSCCLTWSSPSRSYPWSDWPKPAIDQIMTNFSFYNQQSTLFLKIHENPEFHPYDFNGIPLLRHISVTRPCLLSARPWDLKNSSFPG